MNEVEHAIHCFEAVTGLPVVVHDLRRQFWNDLAWQRFRHSQPVCQRVKEGTHGDLCERFEIQEFRSEAHRYAQGRLHRCHAGLVELAQPILDGEGIAIVLFAGPFRLLDTELLDHTAPPSSALNDVQNSLAILDSDRVTTCRELLRQLGARLRCIIADRVRVGVRGTAARRQRIETYLSQRLPTPVRLKDLASELKLSPDRCRHVVEEECGVGFAKLLRQMRLKLACSLLLHTDLTLDQVAIRCGLADPSGFSRVFRQAYDLSPGKWRKRNRE